MRTKGAEFPEAMEFPALNSTWVLAQGTLANTTILRSGTA